MKKISLLYLFLFIYCLTTKAQQVFMRKGKVTFEKKINAAREMEGWEVSDDVKDKMKKYRISNWNLFFDDAQSLYKTEPKKDDGNSTMFIFSGEQTGEMFTDIANSKRIFRKNIINEEYIFKDSIPKVDWKILRDVRIIAGYECRKALAKINDTVYVVAFYTDQILLKGGPEGFTGLPGMILGLAIPRYNTTWFATKVEFSIPKPAELAAPSKGKKAEDEKEYKKLVELIIRYSDKKKPQKAEEIRKSLYSLTL